MPEQQHVHSSHNALQDLEHSAAGAQPGSRDQEGDLLHAFGVVQRQAVDRAASIAYSPCGTMLSVLSAGKALELFRWAWSLLA